MWILAELEPPSNCAFHMRDFLVKSFFCGSLYRIMTFLRGFPIHQSTLPVKGYRLVIRNLCQMLPAPNLCIRNIHLGLGPEIGVTGRLWDCESMSFMVNFKFPVPQGGYSTWIACLGSRQDFAPDKNPGISLHLGVSRARRPTPECLFWVAMWFPSIEIDRNYSAAATAKLGYWPRYGDPLQPTRGVLGVQLSRPC